MRPLLEMLALDGQPQVSWVGASMRMPLAPRWGAAISWQRQVGARLAGSCAHILASAGVCALTLIALALTEMLRVGAESARMLAGFAGIGLLGAGVVIHSRHRVRGLTTADGLRVMAA